MTKTDILREKLYIGNLITVIKNSISFQHKPLTTKSRHSDALVYIICGSCDYHFDDGTAFTATGGDVLYLPNKATYTMSVKSREYKFIFCDFEFLSPAERQAAVYSYDSLKNIDSDFVKLYNTYKSAALSKNSECMSVLYGIYNRIQKNIDVAYIDKSRVGDISSAKLYIDENFGNEKLTVGLLAENLGISEVYFRKLFKAKYAITPSRYLILTRLKNAKKLMKYQFLTLEECAVQSGFSSAQYFCRIFKKETGISPGKYKKLL